MRGQGVIWGKESICTNEPAVLREKPTGRWPTGFGCPNWVSWHFGATVDGVTGRGIGESFDNAAG